MTKMKATLEFNLPKEQHEFRVASRAGEMASDLSDLDMQLKGWLKHGHSFKDVDSAFQYIRDTIREAVNAANGE